MNLANRILSALLALVLLVGGLLAAAEIVAAAFGRGPLLVPYDSWRSWLGEQTWQGAVVRAALAGLAVLGLLLLLCALRRGRPGQVPMPARTDGVQVSAHRRGVERTVAAAARRTDGVSGASVSAGRRTVRVKARTAMRSSGDLDARVGSAVDQRLDDLGMAATMRSRVSVSQEEKR